MISCQSQEAVPEERPKGETKGRIRLPLHLERDPALRRPPDGVLLRTGFARTIPPATDRQWFVGGSRKPEVVSHQTSVISCQLSVVSLKKPFLRNDRGRDEGANQAPATP